MSRFPRLTSNGNESDFPDVANIKTYQYDNTFDYSKFDTVQMKITVCRVPWDMGEAHIGNRTISGIGNVVHFGTKEKRDRWFRIIPKDECFRFSTKYKQLHRDNFIDVPIPFDVASRYNYVAVYHEMMASAENPVMYENEDGLRPWFWFVREVEFLAPNTTRLHLLNDAWQTFIYDMNIPFMYLERGHAPMHEVDAQTFLDDPIGNCSYLLEREANEPDPPRITTKTQPYVFNSGNMYAVVITTANPRATWGNKADGTWKTPSSQFYKSVPCYHSFAVPAANFSTFLANVPEQFIQTIQCVCMMSQFMITLGTSFSFGGQTCYEISSAYQKATIHSISKDDFAFDAKYENIAKLYTYPYSVIALTDSDGNETYIRIEDTNGKIEVEHVTSLVYPWLKLNGHVSSVGKAPAKTISFKNLSNLNMSISGSWHSYLLSLDIPMFAVTQAAGTVNDYSTHFDRAQQATAADNAQSNANASADTAQTNANASADTAQTNQNENATNIVNNAGVTTAANSAVTAAGNTSAGGSGANTFVYNLGMSTSANQIIADNATSTIQANEQQATIAAASGVATSVVSGIASGNPAQAAAGIINGLVGGAATLASMNVGNALTAAQAANAQASNNSNSHHGNTKTYNDTQTQITAADAICAANNTATSSHAANDSATIIANASRDNTTQRANASRDNTTQRANATRDRSTVTSAINNQIKQAALGEPSTFGDFQNGDYATSRPLALYSNVVTQDDFTIRKCGDEFLRYGYTCNCEWYFDGNWCPMEHFTYWKLTDFWVEGLQVPDMYVDKLRFFLFGGVTVWKVPEEIGRISLYENYHEAVEE